MSLKTLVPALTILLGLLAAPAIVVTEDDVSTAVTATTPTALLQHSDIIGVGKTLYVYRVPTRDANGRTKYFDLRIVLTVDNAGRISRDARVVPTPSPPIPTNDFIPGGYSDGEGGRCTLGLSPAAGGRTAAALDCRNRNGAAIFHANWFTGPVAGHPFEPELRAAGIHQIAGARNVSWGEGSPTNLTDFYGAYSCFGYGHIISVNQAGNILSINNFGNNNNVDCNYSFTLIQE